MRLQITMRDSAISFEDTFHCRSRPTDKRTGQGLIYPYCIPTRAPLQCACKSAPFFTAKCACWSTYIDVDVTKLLLKTMIMDLSYCGAIENETILNVTLGKNRSNKLITLTKSE